MSEIIFSDLIYVSQYIKLFSNLNVAIEAKMIFLGHNINIFNMYIWRLNNSSVETYTHSTRKCEKSREI